jgi:hypothetical protein
VRGIDHRLDRKRRNRAARRFAMRDFKALNQSHAILTSGPIGLGMAEAAFTLWPSSSSGAG